MNNKLKNTVLLIATIITIGAVIFGTVYHVGGWAKNIKNSFSWVFGADSESDYQGKRIEKSEKTGDFDTIILDLNIGDVTIEKGSENTITLSASDEVYMPKTECSNGVLRVYGKDKVKTQINGTSINVKVTITVKDDLKSIKGNNALGDLKINGVDADTIDITLNLGDLKIFDCRTKDIELVDNLGDIKLKNTEFESLDVNNDLGDVEIEVTGSEEDYNCDLTVSLGSLRAFDRKYEKSYRGGTGRKDITIVASLGDIKITN